MSYVKRINHPEEVVKLGESIKVLIKEINPLDKKILLSIRDAEGDPWTLVPSKFPVGKIVTGTINKKENFTYLVHVDDGVISRLTKSLYKERSEGDWEHKKIGDQVQIEIAEIKLEDRKMTLRPPSNGQNEAWLEYQNNQQQSASSFGGALGDQLKQMMAKNKK
jgi:small subunit ribosomal protein S1